MGFGQGGPAWGPGGPGQPGRSQQPSAEPDWEALAADAARERRRRRTLLAGGSTLATLAIAAAVALAIVRQGSGEGPAPHDGPTAARSSAAAPEPTGTAEPEPSFEPTTLPPLPKPREFFSDPGKDTAPFTAEGFYAGGTMSVEGRRYARTAVDGAQDCAAGTLAALGAVLEEHGCLALLRATYTGHGTAVTIGVAQFPTEADAEAARRAATGNVLPLAGGGTPAFCGRGGCRTSKNHIGRYVYFTIAGNSDNSPDSGEDTAALRASRDGDTHAHASIVRRGETQASASASALVEERERRDA